MIGLLSNQRSIILRVALFVLMLSAACNKSTGTPPPAGSSPASPPTEAPVAQPGELTLQHTIVFGPGPFIYTDTRAGLADLTSYQAALTLTFDGSKEGQAQKWSRHYVMTAAKDPPARQWTIEDTGDISSPGPVFLAEMGGMDYKRQGEGACSANVIQPGNALGDGLELASFLTGIVGAETAGSETVNGVAADHYTFDQRALGEEGLTQSTGEIWVAAQGGYIVKYLRTTKANADYFGEGVEGTLTLDYELTDANKEVTLQLPEDCPPGLVDAPQLPDATDVENSPGVMSYHSSTSVADAVAFYQKSLEDLGWKPQQQEQEPAASDSGTILNYNRAGQSLMIIIAAGDGTPAPGAGAGVTTVTVIEHAQK